MKKILRINIISFGFCFVVGCYSTKLSNNLKFDNKISLFITKNELVNDFSNYNYNKICKIDGLDLYIAVDASDHGNNNLLFLHSQNRITFLDTVYLGSSTRLLKIISPKLSSYKIKKYSNRIDKILKLRKYNDNW